MKRRLLILSVLMAMFIAVLSTGKSAAVSCHDFCASNWRDCIEWCNGDPACERVYHCDEFYTDCMCTNCGACPRATPPPQR